MFTGIRILIAEDDPFSIILMKEYLRSFNIEIYVAKNGITAYEICNKYNIDIVITDILMPVLNGIELLKNLRKTCRDIIVIAETAYGSNDKLNEIEKAGFDAVITKPYRRTDFINLITKFLHKIKEKKYPI